MLLLVLFCPDRCACVAFRPMKSTFWSALIPPCPRLCQIVRDQLGDHSFAKRSPSPPGLKVRCPRSATSGPRKSFLPAPCAVPLAILARPEQEPIAGTLAGTLMGRSEGLRAKPPFCDSHHFAKPRLPIAWALASSHSLGISHDQNREEYWHARCAMVQGLIVRIALTA